MTERLRRIDALVAEKVMGWVKKTAECNNEQVVLVPPDWTDLSVKRWLGHDLHELVPHYTTSWDAAGLVVEAMLDKAPGFVLEAAYLPFRWYCEFNKCSAEAKTPPLAICRAALKALGGDVKNRL